MRKFLATAAIAALLPTTALAEAEGFTILDLGSVANDAECLDRGKRTYEAYGQQHGGGLVSTGNWGIYAFDVEREEYDSVMLCSFGPEGKVRVSVVVYSLPPGTQEMRETIALRLQEFWKR